MSLNHGSKIVTDGLVLMLDAANVKSFPGEPTTNIVPDPTNNASFTTSNGWSTYNTNMYCDPVGSYGCGVFWSMGTTISSVSSNIVTTTSAHPFRSFDVLRPQTTGGGVTANTDYVIKKISSTQFSLHEYNGSQDGSQGYINSTTGFYKVHDAYATDTRIAVNSTDFPTMWWGAPHLPNSGLIKEIVVGGGRIPGTNCMRLHAYRPDGVTDGMAYGVYPHVTVGDNITISVYLKAVGSNAAGKSLGYSTHFGVYAAPGTTFYLGEVGVWNRYTFSWVASTTYDFISYWWPQGGTTGFSIDMADFQVEIKDHATTFTTGTRGTTVATGGGWKNLSNNSNNGEISSGILYDSNNGGSLSFNGTSYISITNMTQLNNNYTLSAWINIPEYVADTNIGQVIIQQYGSNLGWIFSLCGPNAYLQIRNHYNGVSTSYNLQYGTTLSLNQWYYVNATDDGTTVKLYVNGVSVASMSSSISTPSTDAYIGSWFTSGSNHGKIGIVQCFNRALSSTKILQNYNATKSRYGLT